MSYLPNKEVEIERLTGSLLSTPYFVRLFGSSKRWLKLKERSFLTKALSKRAIWVLFGLRVENITKLAAKPKPSNWPTARFGAMNSAWLLWVPLSERWNAFPMDQVGLKLQTDWARRSASRRRLYTARIKGDSRLQRLAKVKKKMVSGSFYVPYGQW